MFFTMQFNINFKKCTKCGEEKNVTDFYKDKGVKSGIGSRCKDCVKKCSRESQLKNSSQRKEYLKEYSLKNKDRLTSNRRKYVEKHRGKFRNYHREYQVKSRKVDNIKKIKHNVRNRLWSAFDNNNWKKDGSQKLIGCDYNFVINYLESMFDDKMTWDNYGLYGWHIDHIIPLNTAKTKEEMEKLCHYTNLRPMWAKENLSRPKK